MNSKLIKKLVTTIVSMSLLMSLSNIPEINSLAAEPAKYESVYKHDPRINEKAMKDIVVNPNAIYGYSPDPNSDRLGEFAKYDWSDAALVEKAKQERIEYHASYELQFALWEKMSAEGKSVEDIARAVSTLRNENRLAAYKDDAERLASAKMSNLEKYGNEFGPTPEFLFEKYGNWETVLLKSFSNNSGMDACLGLYDIEYDRNMHVQEIIENPVIMYKVSQGDYLVKIAEKYYGDGSAWKMIYQANKDKIGVDYIIYLGEELAIPYN